jgi:hypothetical protein
MYHEVILLGASPPNKDLGASPLNSLQPPDRSPSLNDGFVGGEIPFSVAKS